MARLHILASSCRYHPRNKPNLVLVISHGQHPPQSALDGYEAQRPPCSPADLPGPLPYVKDIFFDKVSPLADIVECTSATYNELEADFKSKYAGTVAIYHFRNPGGPFGYFDEDFFKRLPKSCKLISHRRLSVCRLDPAERSGCRLRRYRCGRCERLWDHSELGLDVRSIVADIR